MKVFVVHFLFLAGIWMGCQDGGGDAPGKDGAVPGEQRSEENGNDKVNGAEIYRWRCASCHLSDGRGIRGQFPPLAGSKRTIGDPEIPVRIVLHGMMGPVVIDGVRYDGLMPGWHDKLRSHEVAAVVSYIRSAWGNGAPGVDTEVVERVKGRYRGRTSAWSVEELER